MTAGTSQVSLVNRALLSIGARATVASLTEGSTESDAANILFNPTFTALARSAAWNCLKQQNTLTLIAAAQGTPENPDGTTLPLPPVPWLYQYLAPSDNLDIRYLIPSLPDSTPTGNPPITTVGNMAQYGYPLDKSIPFSVSYATDDSGNPLQVILTNLSQAIAVYTVNQPNPTIWDSLFEQAFVSTLAAYLCPALSLNIQLMQMCIRQAEAAITQARVRDGDEGETSQNREAQWMQARLSGGYLYPSSAYGNLGGYQNMVWPGGF